MVMVTLPYRFVVPLPIRHAEAADFSDQDWRILEDGGLIIFDLPPERIEEAARIKAAWPKLSANDCFCLVSTRCQERGILLTGDRLLRRVATQSGLLDLARPVKGDAMAQNGGLRPSPYSVFLHESCRYPQISSTG